MKSLIYSLLPYWAIKAIRRRRDYQRRYKLSLRELPTFLDPL